MHEPHLKLLTTFMGSFGNFGLFAWTLSLEPMEPRTSFHTDNLPHKPQRKAEISSQGHHQQPPQMVAKFAIYRTWSSAPR